jgi:uncharacterized membrane protein YoaK (UPF0700 family)
MGMRETLTRDRGPWPTDLPTRHPVRTFYVGFALGAVVAACLSAFVDLIPMFVLPLLFFILVPFAVDVVRERRARY